MFCRAWNVTISSFNRLTPENRPRCTRIWRNVHSSWVAAVSLTADGKYHFLSPSSCVSREFLLMAVSSSRQMPWCTAILGFRRTGHRAWIWLRLAGHGVTSWYNRLQSLHSRRSVEDPRAGEAWHMGIGSLCFVAGAFWTSPRRFCLASVSPKDPCWCLLGWEIQM